MGAPVAPPALIGLLWLLGMKLMLPTPQEGEATAEIKRPARNPRQGMTSKSLKQRPAKTVERPSPKRQPSKVKQGKKF